MYRVITYLFLEDLRWLDENNDQVTESGGEQEHGLQDRFHGGGRLRIRKLQTGYGEHDLRGGDHEILRQQPQNVHAVWFGDRQHRHVILLINDYGISSSQVQLDGFVVECITARVR